MKFIIIYVAFATFVFVSGIMMLLKFKKVLARGLAYLVMIVGLCSLVSVFKIIDYGFGYWASVITFIVMFIIGGGISFWVFQEDKKNPQDS